jgi:hypothetical protein
MKMWKIIVGFLVFCRLGAVFAQWAATSTWAVKHGQLTGAECSQRDAYLIQSRDTGAFQNG